MFGLTIYLFLLYKYFFFFLFHPATWGSEDTGSYIH